MLGKNSSNTIDYLKCLMCIGVVFDHCRFVPDNYRLLWTEWQEIDYNFFNGFVKIFADLFLNSTCVPLFFMISGYLFFLKIDDGNWVTGIKRKIKSRISSLVIPYLIANTIYIVLRYFISGKQYDDMSDIFSGYWMDLLHYGDPPAWFLRDLICCCLLTPILYLSIKKIDIAVPAGLLICWFCGWWYPFIPAFELRSLLMFTIGAYLSLKNVDIVESIHPEKFWLLYAVGYVSLLVSAYFTDNKELLKVSVLASFPMWISIAYLLMSNVGKPCPKVFVSGSFFVFLFHYLYFTCANRLVLAFVGTSVPMCFLAYFLGSCLTVALTFGLYLLLRRHFPRMASVIVGGR